MRATEPTGRTLVVTSVFDAPRERVFQAFTDPAQVKCWWGPQGFTAPHADIDLRPGGRYLYCMRSPEGQDMWSTGVYREIRAPERLVYTDSFADEKGNVVPASHYGMEEEWPLELLVTLTFEEQGGKTKVTFKQAGVPAGDADLSEAGWKESMARLAECLK
ncbi:MAG: SRPBCC family protein [Chloroflexota bacterium]